MLFEADERCLVEFQKFPHITEIFYVATETRQLGDDDGIDAPVLDVLQHPLERWAIRVFARIVLVDIGFGDLAPALVLRVLVVDKAFDSLRM